MALHEYRAYGLNLRSEIALAGLTASRGTVDVDIRFGDLEPAATRPMLGVRGRRAVTASEVYLAYDDVGVLLIRGGREILLMAEPGHDPEGIVPFVLGPGLGTILLQRGTLALHASAVGLGAGACIFLGGPGWGKSTIAGALEQRGHRLIADDIAAVSRRGEDHVIQPGFPTLKLSSESSQALGHDFEAMHQIHALGRKRGRTLGSSFEDTPVFLRRVYVLADGDSMRIESLSGGAAIAELLRHSYAATLIREAGLGESHLRQCAAVAESVPIRRLVRPRSFARLGDVTEALESDNQDDARG